VEWHIERAGLPEGYGEAKQRHAGIWGHWDGEFALAEQKKEWTGALVRDAYDNSAFMNGICDSPALELGFRKGSYLLLEPSSLHLVAVVCVSHQVLAALAAFRLEGQNRLIQAFLTLAAACPKARRHS
jgi:hypothetical protein